MGTILVVEDESAIRNMIGFALTRSGFTTLEAGDSKTAWKKLDEMRPDLILMDWMLPDTSGLEMLKYLRTEESTKSIPVIMLTARSEEEDRINGLNAGADDYICKPFSPRELTARINAVLRRHAPETAELRCDDLVLNSECHTVSVFDDHVELSPTEFRLLHFLMLKPKRVFSREMILYQAWGMNKHVEDRTVDVHILRLRRALLPWGYDRAIETVRGIGYRFSTDKLEGTSNNS